MMLKNIRTFHHRLMMHYLRKRGWVVFYLEEEARECKDMCWLKLYQELGKDDDSPGDCWPVVNQGDVEMKIEQFVRIELHESEAKALKTLLGNMTDDEFKKYGIQGKDRESMNFIYNNISFFEKE